MTTVEEKNDKLTGRAETEYRTFSENIIAEFRHNYLGIAGAVVLIGAVLAALIGPVLSPYSAIDPSYGTLNQAPSLAHPMGTDKLGRDILTRILVGIRYSLLIGAGSIFVAASLGIAFGAIAGYTTRVWVDELIMRVMDGFLAFPAIILGLAIMGLFGVQPIQIGPLEIGNISKIILVIGLVYMPRFARITRGATVQEREMDYVKLGRIEGMSHRKILFNEISLNILSPLTVVISYRLGSAMIIAAGLGFLGIGVQPPTPSLGVMISAGLEGISTGRWWLAIFPGVALALIITSFNLIGDTVRDALDPSVSAAEGQA